MKKWGIRGGMIVVAAFFATSSPHEADAFSTASSAQRKTRRMDVEFRPQNEMPTRPVAAPAKPVLPARVRESKFPTYLKAFNDTHTPGQLYHRLSSVTSPEWKTWYASTHRQVPLHRTSVEFLERDSFLVRTPGTMSLLNTTRMEEGVLMISRRPFPFTLQESLDTIAGRLGRVDVRNRYESRLPIFRIFEILYRSTVSWAGQVGVSWSGAAGLNGAEGSGSSESSVRIAPLLALIDIERSRARCLDILEDVPGRGPASLITTDCRRAIAEQRGRTEPDTVSRPSRRLIVETATGPSPITESGARAPASTATSTTSRAPASALSAPSVVAEGVGRD